jgi:pyrroline-5-carboxylate reductase
VKVGLLGAGHIARALAVGWYASAVPDLPSISCYDIDGPRSAALAADVHGAVASSARELVEGCEIVVLAVRPPDVAGVLSGIGPFLGDRALVSVAAGVRVERLLESLPQGARAGRVMPNVAVAVGRGVLLLAEGTLGERLESVETLFALSGSVVPVAEELFDEATAVSGCGPGFVALFAEALAGAAVGAGLDEATAARLVAATLAGTAGLLDAGQDPGELWRGVAVPGGMTAAGIDELEAGGLAASVRRAVTAAVARARELA